METALFKPPDKTEVYTYFIKLGLAEKHSDAFYFYYSMKDWILENGQKTKNWKVLAYNWVCSFGKAKPFRKKSIHC